MNKLIAAAAFGAALLAAGPASAQDAPPPRFDPLARADANKDGILTKAELLATVDARFRKLDADSDGKITAEERQARAKALREQRMAKRAERRAEGAPGAPGKRGRMHGGLDADGDGAVSLEELRAQAIRRFDRIDANKDGQIDAAERAAAREKMRTMRGRRGPPPSPPADGQ